MSCSSVICKVYIMKKSILSSIFAMLLAIVCVSCEQPVEPLPEPQKEDFDILIHDVSRGTVCFSVTPKDAEMDYLCLVLEKAEVEEFTREEFLVQNIFMDIESEAYDMGKTFEEYMSEVVDKGEIENVSFSGLKNDTEHCIIIFGVDAQQGYAQLTPVTMKEFKTINIPKLVCDFRVSHSVEDNSVSLSVDPTDVDLQWYLCTMPVEQYNYYVEDETGYQMSHEYFYEYFFQQEINSLLQQGLSEQQVVDALIHQGALTLEAKGLKEHTEYYFLIAGLIVDQDGILIFTDVQRGSYTTKGAAQSTMTFDIKVWDVGQMEASFSITPSNNNDKYCALVAPWDGVTSAQDMMHNLVEQWGGWMDMMANDRGPVEHSGSTAMKLPAADTDYYIIAFGYDGGITTEACMKTFRTLPGGSLEEVVFELSASSVTPYGFTMNVKSSDRTIYYVPGLCKADEYDEEAFIGYENEAFNYYVEEYKKFNPSITIAEILDQYYYNGNATLQVSGLQPDTEYLGYIYALDVHTGHVDKCFTFPAFARTSQFSTIAPQVELFGYFSGDDENGALFGDANATKGRAITVVKYSDLDDIRTLFTTMVEGDCSSPVTMSDGELWQLTSGYWDKCSVQEPYTFYLVDWNVVQTALCYATDNNGMIGPISRLYTCPTADNKGSIADLKALVDELNVDKASTYAMPSSLVVAKPSSQRPVIKPIE